MERAISVSVINSLVIFLKRYTVSLWNQGTYRPNENRELGWQPIAFL